MKITMRIDSGFGYGTDLDTLMTSYPPSMQGASPSSRTHAPSGYDILDSGFPSISEQRAEKTGRGEPSNQNDALLQNVIELLSNLLARLQQLMNGQSHANDDSDEAQAGPRSIEHSKGRRDAGGSGASRRSTGSSHVNSGHEPHHAASRSGESRQTDAVKRPHSEETRVPADFKAPTHPSRRGDVVSQNNFDQAVPFKNTHDFKGGFRFQASNPDRFQTVNDPLGQRSGKVARIDYRSGDDFYTPHSHNPRSELRSEKEFEAGKTYNIRSSMLFKDKPPGAIIAQVFDPKSNHPTFKLNSRTNGDLIASVRDTPNGQPRDVRIGNLNDPEFKGKWIDWNVSFKPDAHGKASLILSANGKQVFERHDFTTAAGGQYYKTGLYMDSQTRSSATMYLDDFAIAES